MASAEEFVDLVMGQVGDKPTFGYWDVRGLGEPIRMVLRWVNTSLCC